MITTIPRLSAKAVEETQVTIGDHAIPLGCFPFIVTDLVSSWRATHRWNLEYLRRRFGGTTISCFIAPQGAKAFLQQVNTTKDMRFSDFLEIIFGVRASDTQHYLRINATDPLFELLSPDFHIPSLLPNYTEDATGIWMGHQGNLTPFHHDWWHGFLAQISGTKRFALFHPFEGHLVQREWTHAQQFDLAPAPYYPANDQRLRMLSTCVEGTLGPGDMLYIPPFWFHQIETLDNGNISIPIRFDTRQDPALPIFQLSQHNVLRPLTNRYGASTNTVEEYVKKNREYFEQSEQAFIRACKNVRANA